MSNVFLYSPEAKLLKTLTGVGNNSGYDMEWVHQGFDGYDGDGEMYKRMDINYVTARNGAIDNQDIILMHRNSSGVQAVKTIKILAGAVVFYAITYNGKEIIISNQFSTGDDLFNQIRVYHMNGSLLKSYNTTVLYNDSLIFDGKHVIALWLDIISEPSKSYMDYIILQPTSYHVVKRFLLPLGFEETASGFTFDGNFFYVISADTEGGVYLRKMKITNGALYNVKTFGFGGPTKVTFDGKNLLVQ